MATERTLSIVKPSSVADNNIGGILNKFESAGLTIVAAKMLQLSQEQAEGFYAVHKDRPFFGELVEFMLSGPIMVQVLEGEDAIKRNRDIMGATNPADAEPGTIRAEFGKDISENAVHGSDAPETAKTEIAFFFKDSEIISR
jgi:nucleoside-diphosphate kinase